MENQRLLSTSLSTSYNQLIKIIDDFYDHKYWQTKLLVTSLLVIIVSTTPFFNFNYFDGGSSWNTILQQANTILVPFKGTPGSHDANKVFRLAVPLFVTIFKLNKIGLFISQIICGIIIIYVAIRKTFSIVDDRVVTVLFTIPFVSCYIGYSSFYDVFGRVDTFGYLFILLSTCIRNPVAVFLMCTLTAWTDERGLINTFFTAVYWLSAGDNKGSGYNGSSPIKLTYGNSKYLIAIILSWIGYFALRWYLSYYCNFHTETSGVGLREFSKSRHYIPIGIFSTYGAIWLLIGAAIWLFICQKQWELLGLILVGCAVNFMVILLITDIDRSLSYSIPFIFVCLLKLSKTLNRDQLRKFFFMLAVFALIIPTYDFDSHLHYHPNVLIRLGTLILGVS